jgi:DNA-binding transcriptional ArsR family regulator
MTGPSAGATDAKKTIYPFEVQAVQESLDSLAKFLYIIDKLYNQLAMNASSRLDATFAALADPTRRAILARLVSGEASVMELARPFAMSQPAISKHLQVLERAGLISRGREAQRRPRRIEPKALAEANAWLENYRQFWEARFERLDALLDEMQGKGKQRLQMRSRKGTRS